MRSTGLACNQILVIILAAVGASSAANATQNLAYDKQYQCSTEILPAWTGLTDGVKDSDQAPGCFATDNSPRFPKEVIIDLGGVYTVTKISVYNSLNGNTRHMAVWLSPTLDDFEQLREYYFPPNQVQPLIHSFEPRQARYVKITLYDTSRQGVGGENCLYLREVEVYGEDGGSQQTTESVRDFLRLAALRPPLFAPHSVRLFQRYCLERQPRLLVGILGDSFARQDSPDQPHWLDLFVEQASSREVQTRNLAAPRQDPRQGAQLLAQLQRPEAVDVLIIAYGSDATRIQMAPARFRRDCQYLLQEALSKLPALVVVVSPWPWAQTADSTGQAQSRGPSTAKMTEIIEEVAALAGCAVVHTSAVLGRHAGKAPRLYQNDFATSPEAHQALAAALLQLLRGGPTNQ